MQRSLLSLAALTVFAAAANAQQCFEQNFGVLAPLEDPAVGDLILQPQQAVGLAEPHGGALLVVLEMESQLQNI